MNELEQEAIKWFHMTLYDKHSLDALALLEAAIKERDEQIETLSGQLEGYINTHNYCLEVIKRKDEEIAVRDRAITWAQGHGICSICAVQAKCNLGEIVTCPTNEEFIKAALDAAKEG